MTSANRWLFVATILTGSFLLFLIQPMVARMALPRLGGAPAVWNSAMLVYQALLLCGYAYAHLLSRFAIRRQAMIHLVVLVLAGLTLPIALADLAPPASGWEALWVPLLFLLTIGPVFFAVSAQAPLMQRWYAADRHAGDPYWLYAASNLGSFAGLIAYPLLFEPNIALGAQSMVWALGYLALVVLVALAAYARRSAQAMPEDVIEPAPKEPVDKRRIALWLALSAIPSGLMLSTTTHLTTDIVAMPLLWVIPLGLYLLSFSIAFREQSLLADMIVLFAPITVLLAGALTMTGGGSNTMVIAFAMVLMLFVFAVSLHRRLYLERPDPSQLTLFYLVMSAGGALGGLFTALIAPMLFDWVWEHPLLILAGAALLLRKGWTGWIDRLGISKANRRPVLLAILLVTFFAGWVLVSQVESANETGILIAMVAMAACALLLLPNRAAFVLALLGLMLARSGFETVRESWIGERERSFFGVYAVRENAEEGHRDLIHGTTLHGRQFLEEQWELEPTTYYSRTGGAGLVLANAEALVGPDAHVGVVGLGIGTLACYKAPGQTWEFFEIDPVVLQFSQDGHFTYMDKCTPEAETHIGDARLVLEGMEAGRFDVLAVDAFSSDAIPLHLMTREAFAIYKRALAEDGVLLVHISNRFLDLAPMVQGVAEANGLSARVRRDMAPHGPGATASVWIALAEDAAKLDQLPVAEGDDGGWEELPPAPDRIWTDDFASILPFLRWGNVLGTGS